MWPASQWHPPTPPTPSSLPTTAKARAGCRMVMSGVDWLDQTGVLIDWLNFREALLLEEPMCLIDNIPKKEACLDFNQLCVGNLMCQWVGRRQKFMHSKFHVVGFFIPWFFYCNENNRVCHFMIRHHFLYQLTSLVGEDVLKTCFWELSSFINHSCPTL